MGMRTTFLALLLAAGAVAHADERVVSFDAGIVVSREGEVTVTETIEIVSEDDRFRKGLNRDLDLVAGMGALDVTSVTRDGEEAPFKVEDRDGTKRIRIGSADRPLSRGTHSYEIVYRIDNGIIASGDRDMLSWDVAGAWDVPIDNISATIKLPTGVRILGIETFAGTPDRPRDDLRMKEKSGALSFSTRGGLAAEERLRIELRFPRDAIGPKVEE
jgi:hypothetical protein